jgi:hypothetical protein
LYKGRRAEMNDLGKPGSKERLDWMVEQGILRHAEDEVDMTKFVEDLVNIVDDGLLKEISMGLRKGSKDEIP